jgi:CHRD domain/PEP-CTERM motif
MKSVKRVLLGLSFMAAVPMFGSTFYSTSLAGGTNEVPPTVSSGVGAATLLLDGDTLNVKVSFSDLTSGSQAGHIHCCGPLGVNDPVAVPFSQFPAGVTSGNFTQSFDLASQATYSADFVTGNGGTATSAEAALVAGLNAGEAYVNIHTVNNPGGEIRGQLAATPEPSTMMLGGLAIASLCIFRRKRLFS